MASWSHSLSEALRRRIAGLAGAVAGSGSQGVRALLLALGVCFADSAWGQDLQIAGRGKIREKLRQYGGEGE